MDSASPRVVCFCLLADSATRGLAESTLHSPPYNARRCWRFCCLAIVCSWKRLLSQRKADELLGDNFQPGQQTQLRTVLQLSQTQQQQAQRRYTTQPAARRPELKRTEAGAQAQMALFMTAKQHRLFRRHRAKIERRLGFAPVRRLAAPTFPTDYNSCPVALRVGSA